MAKAPATKPAAEGKTKLAYFLTGTEVRIVLHTADAKGEIGPADKVNEVVVDAAALPAIFMDGETQKTLMGYGILKLLQDRTSQVSSSTSDKFAAMVKEAQRLAEADEAGHGKWKATVVRAEGAGSRSTKKVDTFLAQALVEIKGISLAQATEALKALDKEQVKALASNAKVVAIVERLKGEANAAGPEGADLADLLG